MLSGFVTHSKKTRWLGKKADRNSECGFRKNDERRGRQEKSAQPREARLGGEYMDAQGVVTLRRANFFTGVLGVKV